MPTIPVFNDTKVLKPKVGALELNSDKKSSCEHTHKMHLWCVSGSPPKEVGPLPAPWETRLLIGVMHTQALLSKRPSGPSAHGQPKLTKKY